MTRLLIAAFAAALVLLPTTAEGQSSLRLRGTVTLKDSTSHLVTLRAARISASLRVPGSLARIRIGQRVELRGSVLRARGNGSRVLARGVSLVSAEPLSTSRPRDGEPDDDEVEIKGDLTSLAPLTVRSATRTVTCTVPAGVSLAGFVVGDFVEITCDLIGGVWVLRVLKHEDDDDREDRADRDDDRDDDDGRHNRGHGGGHDDDDDDDDDDDSSGPGSGHDD